jgi:quercetin dioxygenase-like cupin family protein
MFVTRVGDAKPYTAPAHFDVSTLQLQGLASNPTHSFTVGLTHLLPGGGAAEGAAPIERVYVVLTGEITVRMGDAVHVLGPLDSIHIDRSESRSVKNETNLPASMLVVIELPQATA